ncbi:protein serac1 [Fusarium flagelliforme]|uniref:Protein serac1 n=1 Tax=Fusarium flagelliforme TaxID=2675880 RepID=A0A395M6V2_9HYPO|nr:protein serac1 [Fusarium flagelliforme]
MVLAAAFYRLVLLLSVALLYEQVTRRIPSRLDPYQAPKAKLGLVPVGTSETLARAGGVEKAAADSEEFVDWVSEFLPNDLPAVIQQNIRIFYYNYDSYWKRDAVHTRLANLGDELLEHIRGIRSSDAHWSKERSRHLAFVGYSYGGLVVKQALVRAQASRDLSHVSEQTRAILFLGTPHRGSSFGTWGWLAAYAFWLLKPNLDILGSLEYDSTSLLDLHRAFTGTTRDTWRIYNFFEQRPTQIFRLWLIQWQQLCVREPSATYDGPNIRNIGVPVDHSGLNKFGSRSDSYQAILSKLIEATVSLPDLRKQHYAVPFGRVHTYTERAELSRKLEEKLRIRHKKAHVPHAVALFGLGGSGKSQLALDYTEKHRDEYDSILWIDATNEGTARLSFRRCAAVLGLPEERARDQGSVVTDTVVHTVLQWLHDRAKADSRWLVIIDNADDVSWGLQRIMPKGESGSILITSQDEQSTWLVPGGCEKIQVGAMSPAESSALLLQHLQMDAQSATEATQRRCEEVADKLGHLALAVELAGAYIGNDAMPAQALLRYIEDYDEHRDELLRMEHFHGLLPTQKTIWTAWQTTLDKITTKHGDLQAELLLMVLAQFRGTIIQDEMLRLASLGMSAVDAETADQSEDRMPSELQRFFLLKRGKWDSFYYRQARDILVRYSLLQQVEVAACRQLIAEQKPDFRRHLVMHLPGSREVYRDGARTLSQREWLVGPILGQLYHDEGLWKDAESLFVQVMETFKTKLGADHPESLKAMGNLASTYRNQGRWADAESLEVQVMETRKTKLGADHPETLRIMANLASTYRNQGRWADAESLEVQVMEMSKTKLGADHPDTLRIMANLHYLRTCPASFPRAARNTLDEDRDVGPLPAGTSSLSHM